MLKKIAYLVATLSLIFAPMLAVGYSYAATSKDAVCGGIGLTTDANNGCAEDSSSPSVNNVIHAVISIMSYLVGVLSVILVIVSGFKYMTAGGDSGKVKSAKDTLVYALIGVVIAAMAQILVRFVITSTTATPSSSPSANCSQNGAACSS